MANLRNFIRIVFAFFIIAVSLWLTLRTVPTKQAELYFLPGPPIMLAENPLRFWTVTAVLLAPSVIATIAIIVNIRDWIRNKY